MDWSNIKSRLSNKQDLTFLVLGILMCAVVFFCIYYSINFLTVQMRDVLNSEKATSPTQVQFNIDKLKSLEAQKLSK